MHGYHAMRTLLFSSALLAVIACSGATAPVVTGQKQEPSGVPGTPAPDPGCKGPSCGFDGNGFVVHEWGTNTFVVGSDGKPLRGLHHEEEGLPSFVYDRVKAGSLEGSLSVEAKMETPVTYFYSAKPLTAKVQVAFPQGVLTQWYPAVRQFYPGVASRGTGVIDPMSTLTCEPRFRFANGLLDWGEVQVLPRDQNVDALLPAAPLDRFAWSHARAVAANPLKIAGAPGAEMGQHERFLFYRGLGNFPPPAAVSWDFSGAVTVKNGSPNERIGAVFVLDVEAERAAFTVVPAGIAPSLALTQIIPADKKPIDAYADALSTAIVAELDKSGLYHDESMSMVNTWRRQWFRTPGIRVLYLAPQAWIDQSIPLTIDPKPEKTTRVMVIRVEVLTPGEEEVDMKLAAAFDSPGGAAVAHFASLGRFAEPRLRRALALLAGPPPVAAAAYLAQISKTNTQSGLGE